MVFSLVSPSAVVAKPHLRERGQLERVFKPPEFNQDQDVLPTRPGFQSLLDLSIPGISEFGKLAG